MGCDLYSDTALCQAYKFQSTHPSWGATRNFLRPLEKVKISIHAPIVGCDFRRGIVLDVLDDFNPRTHRGVRRYIIKTSFDKVPFQSTHPSWGATHHHYYIYSMLMYFNPRTHRGVRQWSSFISTNFMSYFNPRTHRGVRHITNAELKNRIDISIHAPIVGCDKSKKKKRGTEKYFNPRTHRGVRR